MGGTPGSSLRDCSGLPRVEEATRLRFSRQSSSSCSFEARLFGADETYTFGRPRLILDAGGTDGLPPTSNTVDIVRHSVLTRGAL